MAKRFLCYNTEDAEAGKVNVDEHGCLKPGKSTVEKEEIIIPETSMTANGWESNLASDNFTVGDEVTVYWDGVKYGPYVIDNVYGGILGNKSLAIPTYDDTGEPFAIQLNGPSAYVYNNYSATTALVKVTALKEVDITVAITELYAEIEALKNA